MEGKGQMDVFIKQVGKPFHQRASRLIGGAEGGTRTPMPFRAQRPERCVSTSFTTSAEVSCGQGYHTVTLANCQEVFGVLGWALLEFSFSLSSVGKRVIISVRYPVKSLSL